MAEKNSAAEGVRARLAARDKQVEEFYARQEGLQPTPTQEENDMFRVGAMNADDEKEDDGSEWEEEHVTRMLTARVPGENPYDIREIENRESRPARRGRPAKSKGD